MEISLLAVNLPSLMIVLLIFVGISRKSIFRHSPKTVLSIEGPSVSMHRLFSIVKEFNLIPVPTSRLIVLTVQTLRLSIVMVLSSMDSLVLGIAIIF